MFYMTDRIGVMRPYDNWGTFSRKWQSAMKWESSSENDASRDKLGNVEDEKNASGCVKVCFPS